MISYYLKHANEIEKRGETESALIIRELYFNKRVLEKVIKTISEGRDILIREQCTMVE